MRKHFEFDATGIGFSNRRTVTRMRHMGKAGLVLTAVGLVLSAVTYHDAWHNTLWCTTEDENLDGRVVIDEATGKVLKQWKIEKCYK